MRILIAEDKARMASLLQRALQREGYVAMVAHDGEAALMNIQNYQLDAVVMDVMMPKLDGFQVLTRMRSEGVTAPVILLTARDSSEDIVHGLDAGADDYLVKPFELAVLLARLRALTRRPAALVCSDMRVGDLLLRREAHDVICGGREIHLTRMEFMLLEALMKRAGHVVRKETLAEIGWGQDAKFHEGTLYVFIRSLRNKLQTADGAEVLHTVRGVGYKLQAHAAA